MTIKAPPTPPEPKWFGAAFRRYSTDNWSYGLFRSKQAAGQFATKSDGPDASGKVIPLYTQAEKDAAVKEAVRDTWEAAVMVVHETPRAVLTNLMSDAVKDDRLNLIREMSRGINLSRSQSGRRGKSPRSNERGL